MNAPHGEEWMLARLLELPEGQRAAFLKLLAAEFPSLAERARDPRLASKTTSNSSSRKPAVSETEGVVQALESALAAADPDGPGARIGPYRLLQKLGEGGFGVVWMAEQAEPICRRVALKIIKAGMDTREVIARFEAERQALALMDHPNIASVFDAGSTASGRPYFVMELVRGIPITRYCDENRLSPSERLRLFTAVCNGVQHAHHKGVVHRDIKPSNILVTLHDGVPVPKIIDFGIAKATTGLRLTEKTLFTQFHAFVGTPVYTSPEQMEMSGLDVDTRSDIYSLGVLLYELLAGRPPFDPDSLVKSGLDAMRRTIRDVDPPRPSHRLFTLGATERTTVARQRSTDVVRLRAILQGDLDWIVMRCLEKDRTRRYESASLLVADIEHHLNEEPVSARPPSRLYRTRKFVKRHRVGVAAVVAIGLSLFAGLATSSVLLVREHSARARAVASERAEADLRREADNAREQETIRASATARDLAGQLLAQERASEGIAWLVHAARTNPRDSTLAPRLASALASRRFLLPAGPVVKLPSPISNVHYVAGGAQIAAYGEDGTVAFVDTGSGAVRTVKLPAGLAAPGVVSTGEATIVLGSDHIVRVLDPTTARIQKEFSFGQRVVQISATHRQPPDLLVVLEDRSLVIAETASGWLRKTPIKVLPTTLVAWSPDARWVATMPALSREGQWWDTVTGSSTALTALGRRIGQAHFSPDGTRLVVIHATEDQMFVCTVTEFTGLPVRWGTPRSLPEHPPVSAQMHVRFDRRGRVFAICSQYGTQLFNSETGEKLGPFIADSGLNPVAFKGEERRRRLSVGGPYTAFRGTLFRETSGGLQIITPSALDARVEFSLRDAATGNERVPRLSHPAGIADVRLCDDGSTALALAGDGSLLLWNLDSGELVAEPVPVGSLADFEVALSPDGREIAVGGADGTLRRMRVAGDAARPLCMARHEPMPAGFSSERPDQLLWFTRDALKTIDLRSHQAESRRHAFPEPVLGIGRSQEGLALRDDGKYAVVQTKSGMWKAWEFDAGRVKREVPLGVPSKPGSVFFGPGDLMAIVPIAADEPIRIWNLTTGEPAGAPFVHGDRILTGDFRRPFCFSHDGGRFLVVGARGVVKLCERETGRVVGEITPAAPSSSICVDASADGSRIVTSHRDYGTQLRDAVSLRPVGPALSGVLARFSTTSARLLTYGSMEAQVWDARTGDAISDEMIHPGTGIRDARFSPDGRYVATAAQDSTARIWDALSGQPVTEPLLHKTRVVACTFSPDGRFLLTEEAGGHGQRTSFSVWSVPPKALGVAPEWLLRLATMYARVRVDDRGRCQALPDAADAFDDLRLEVMQLSASDPLAEWGRWLLDRGVDRSIAPGFGLTEADAARLAVEVNHE